jgi:hypothetical protein
LEVDAAAIVDLGGKVKFPRGEVVHVGDQISATKYIAANGGAGKAIVGATVTAGDYGRAIVGDYGRATVGKHGRATAGDRGIAIVGDHGAATAGNYATACAGERGRATAGTRGRASAGDRGRVSAGDDGIAIVGDHGAATAGYRGRVSAGDNGTLCLWEYDGHRRRLRVAYVGENGIKPNVPYRLVNGTFQSQEND